MTFGTIPAAEQTVEVGDVGLHLLRGGSGRPVLVLHGIEGPEGWLDFHDLLAQRRRSPGARRTPATASRRGPPWLESITGQAMFYEWFLRVAGLQQGRPRRLRHRRLDRGRDGGDELAATSRHLVLVDAAGIKPARPATCSTSSSMPWREVVAACVDDPETRRGVPAHLQRRARPGLRRRPRGRALDVDAHVLPPLHVLARAACRCSAGIRSADARRLGRRGPDHPARVRPALQSRDPGRRRCGSSRTAATGPTTRTRRAGGDHPRVPRRADAASRPFSGAGVSRSSKSEAAVHKTSYYYFTEQPYTGYDPALQDAVPGAAPARCPTRNFDPELASDLYNRYHEEYIVADDVGFDGIMINEHHTAPFCMQASINITGTVLAKITQQRPHPHARQPAAGRRQPAAPRRRTGHDRHDLARASDLRLRARRRRREPGQQRQPGVQPRALRGGARPDHGRLDAARPLRLGRQALPVPRRQPLGAAAAEAAPAGHGPRHRQPGDRHLGRQAPLPLRRAGLLARADEGADRDLPRDGGGRRLRDEPGAHRLSHPRLRRR